uniref:Ubiquitin-like domain-containing protein n=1 Tax=Leersia perrieri TaxID=77586 RepID=A0A0D9X0N4_9ORYZ
MAGSRSAAVDGDTKNTVAPIFITLKIIDQDDRRVRHAIRMTDNLQTIMDMYYTKASKDVPYGTGTFMFEGVRVRGHMTPMSLEMVDGDTIDYFPVLIGGGRIAAKASCVQILS